MHTLDGIRILDLTRLLPGAICTLILADMGADVIKVEDPNGGDYARWMQPMVEGQGAFFRTSNRNKRSVIVDLKQADGQQVLHELVKSADVVIEGFRPGVTARLGVDYDTLKAINPRLVYCSLSGWGQTGPYADSAGHDLNYVALSGLQGATRTPQPLGGQIADVGGSYTAVMGILAALLKRERTGTGDYIDVALFESGMLFSMFSVIEALSRQVPRGEGVLTGGSAYYDVYWCEDNQPIAFAPIEDKFFRNFCQAVGRDDLLELHTDTARQTELRNELAMLFATRTAAQWETLLADVDCCVTRITPPAGIIADPHVIARDMAGQRDGVPYMRSPVHLAGDERLPIGNAPGYGEHTRAILTEAGMTPSVVDDLFARGVVADKSDVTG